MRTVIELIKQLQGMSGTNSKLKLLKDNSNNELFKKVLYYTYNPYLKYGFSEEVLDKLMKYDNEFIVPLHVNNDVDSIFKLLDKLATNNINDLLRFEVRDLLVNVDSDLRNLIRMILLKDLRAGISSKSINKSIPGLIPEFGVMLADSYWKKQSKVKHKDFKITKKLDGHRLVMIKDHNGNIEFRTRQGKPMEGLVDIERECKNLPNGIVLDGELIAVNRDNLHSKDLYALTTKLCRKKGIKRDLEFNVFDYIPYDDFVNGHSDIKCSKRKEIVHNLIEMDCGNWVIEVPVLYSGDDTSMVEKLLDEITEAGGEGVMVNLSDAPYDCKRTSNILKVKKFNEADVRVLDLLEGTGKNKGRLGSITIQFEYEGELWTCDCGSGFNDDELDLYWEHKELLLNKIVTIKYFEVTKDSKTGKYGLRFPTWTHRIRDDKDEISMY